MPQPYSGIKNLDDLSQKNELPTFYWLVWLVQWGPLIKTIHLTF